MSAPDAALAVLVMAVWGVNFAVAKTGLSELPPLLMMALRFALVAALLVPFARRPRVPARRLLALSMTLGVAHFGLLFTGMRGVDASAAAIVIQLQVPFAVLLGVVAQADRPGWRRWLGIAVAFAGAAVVSARPGMEASWPYLLLVLGAALVWAVANVQIKALGTIDGFALNGWLALLAAPQLAVLSALLEDGQVAALAAAGWRGYGAVAYMAGLATILGYGLWYYVIRKYPMSLAMPFTLLAPVFGVAAGVAFLGEPLAWQMVVGGLVTLAGVAIIVIRRPRLVSPEAEAATGP